MGSAIAMTGCTYLLGKNVSFEFSFSLCPICQHPVCLSLQPVFVVAYDSYTRRT